MTTRRRAWPAALLNLLTPGLGHLYAGRPGMAAAVALVLVPIVTALALIAVLAIPVSPLNVWCMLVLVLAFVGGVPIHAAVPARRTRHDYTLQPDNRWYVYLLVFLIVGLGWQRGLWLLTRARVTQAFRIPSSASVPTLLVGDYLIAAKWPSARVAHEEGLVVFRSIETPGLMLIKRAAGLPGDTLQMRAGVLYRNGRSVEVLGARPELARPSDDPQLTVQMRQWQVRRILGRDPVRYAPTPTDWGPFVVPTDSFFALGDNRADSYDSKEYGFVPMSSVIGRPWVVYFSVDPDDGIRWERIGKRIR